ncbi:MAG: type II secretion system protein [Myxococcota bacterium]
MRRQHEPNGFTLIEVAVMLAVVGILAAVLVPDYIEVQRTDLGEQTAVEVISILDSAKWYYTGTGTDFGNLAYDENLSRWPGDSDSNNIEDAPNSAEACLRGNGPAANRCNVQRLSASDMINPWGEPYELNLYPAGIGGGIGVRTNVPATAAGVLRAYLPGGECETGSNGGLAPQFCPAVTPRPSGFVTCCSTIPRPGNEASYQAMTEEQTPIATDGDGCSAFENTCPQDWTQRGLRCSGKECSDADPYCCPPGAGG